MNRIRKNIPIFLIALGLGIPATFFAQANPDANVKRVLNYDKAVYKSANFNNLHSIRIENAKIWINGNLIPKSNLPAKLQNISSSYVFQATLFGGNEFKFSLMGSDFLVKHGKIVEITPPKQPAQQGAGNTGTLSRADYYGSMKTQKPKLFSSQVLEAELHQQAIQLSLDYQMADAAQKKKIEVEMKTVLDQLFEINVTNELNELSQMEEEIATLRKEVEFRKLNKQQVINNRLKELKSPTPTTTR